MNKKIVIISLILFIIAISFIPIGISLNKTITSENYIYDGIYINDIDVGGMTKEEAAKVLYERFSLPIQNKNIKLIYNDKSYTLSFKELNAKYNIDESVAKAFNYGKDGNLLNKTMNRRKIKKENYKIQLGFSYDFNKVDELVKNISSDINVNGKDASITYDNGKFKVSNDVSGLKVNEEKLKGLIKKEIEPNSKVDKINIPVDVVEARIKSEMLSKVNTKISTFTTYYRASDVDRTENLRIACSAINGVLLMPGETFSMNKALGPRLAEKGYKEAPVIIESKVIPGLAGGICQVTTTVYNAALLANLPIVERSQHGLVVSYTGPGRDATISGNEIDLKFKNSNKYPIYIQSYLNNGGVVVNLFGANEHPGQSVEIVTEIYERVKADVEYIDDNTLGDDSSVVEQRPIEGIKSKTYKKIYQDGNLVRTDLVSKDYYKPVKGKIRVGKKTSRTSKNTSTP